MTNDSTTPNARGIIETTLANGHRIGDLTREDAQHILSALRAAADASDGDTITIAADGTLGRLSTTYSDNPHDLGETICYMPRVGRAQFVMHPQPTDVVLYRVVTP